MTRKEKDKLYANIILSNFLVNEFILYKYRHPKVKSNYKLASLFIKKSKLDIEKEAVYAWHKNTNCNDLVKYADKWLEETIKIAKFNWLDD